MFQQEAAEKQYGETTAEQIEMRLELLIDAAKEVKNLQLDQ